MTDARLKSELWVKAQIRHCDLATIPAVITRRGDPDAGAVYLVIDRHDPGSILLSRTYGPDGGRVWHGPLGDDPLPASRVGEYLEKQARFDPDFWVLEIDDPSGRYSPIEDGI